MKKILVLILVTIIVLQPIVLNADTNNAGFEGGIYKNEQDYNDTKQYKEVIFLTGQPIVLLGTVEKKVDEDELTYEYKLSNNDGTVTLDRDIEIERIIDNTSHEKQTIETNNIVDFDEEINVNGQTYELIDYQFHNSSLDDSQPIVDFYAGNWLGNKTYTLNEDQAQVIVEITGEIFGYNHYWGATQTQRIRKEITYQQKGVDDPEEWFGFGDIDISFNKTKKMEYFNNLPFQTSFSGSYTLTEQEETVMMYSYNLPILDAQGQATINRNKGNEQARFETLPTQKKLFVPKYEDIRGHWAEKDIMRISSLKITDQEQKYFGPKIPTKRVDFARWVSIAMNLVEEEEEVKRSYVKPDTTLPIFSDISKDDINYKYIKAVKEKGIMNGAGDNKFLPDSKLTRVQAITMVIRALGLEGLAPNLPFETRFNDDSEIPIWAKKSVYVAEKLSIVQGTPEGYLYPNEYMNKAEAATFINRFITYLQKDLKKDYIDNIIKYY